MRSWKSGFYYCPLITALLDHKTLIGVFCDNKTLITALTGMMRTAINVRSTLMYVTTTYSAQLCAGSAHPNNPQVLAMLNLNIILPRANRNKYGKFTN